MEKQLFLSIWMWEGWWSNCLPFCLPYPYSPCDSHNQSQFTALMTFPPSLLQLPSTGNSWIFVNMQMSLLSHHSTAVKSALVLMQKSPHFNFTVLGARPSGIPLLFCLTVPQQHVCFFVIAMYNLYSSPSLFLVISITVTWVAVTYCAMCYPSPSILSCHTGIQSSHKVLNFDAKMLAFLWYVLAENHPSFEGNKNFANK